MSKANEPAFPASQIHHKSGGLEQAILQAVSETQELSDKDQQRLDYLKSQDQFYRTEIRIPERDTLQGHPETILQNLKKQRNE